MSVRRALITGITGQDGSYLAEFLLGQGYEVHGMVRRSSTEKFERVEHIRERLILHQGDLLDQRSLVDALRAARPDEIYNLAAMSYVAASWAQPTLTAEFSGTGVTRLLEAMREVCPQARFYQASSSEMFGKVREVPQSELTPFYPRSPYGVAKAYGHFITVNYRESYGLHATSGILFNHECCSSDTPFIVRDSGVVAVKTPLELMPIHTIGPDTQTFQPRQLLEVWDGDAFTPVLAITATRRRESDAAHRLLSIETRAGRVVVTAHHRMLDADRVELPAAAVEPGARLALAEAMPEQSGWTSVTSEMAEFLGLMAADGHVYHLGAHIDFANNDERLRFRVAELWSKLFLGSSSAWQGRSGWKPENSVDHVRLIGRPAAAWWLREQLYTRDGLKQVPPLILNADADARCAFLRGHYAGDGLKRGNGASVKTNSSHLAQGLYWLYHLEGQSASVYAEQRADKTYYQLNLPSPLRVGARGQHLRRDPAEVRRVTDTRVPDDRWVFDLETESGTFCAGVGRIVVHNSPRRGLEFVTRKITWHAAAIKLGRKTKLELGNLDAERDWGFAGDYVRAMWMMLQRDQPEDFVVATGVAHSVRECVEIAFEHAGLPIDEHVVLDPALLRPAEVEHLVGDASKASRMLGWKPDVSFEALIRMMVDADYALLGRELSPRR